MRIEVQYNDISGHQEALKVSDIATALPKFEENRSNILIIKPQNTKALRIYCLLKILNQQNVKRMIFLDLSSCCV